MASSSACPDRSSRPDQRLLMTPGSPPRASTHRPESSANVGRPPEQLEEVAGLRQRVLLERVEHLELIFGGGLGNAQRREIHDARAVPGEDLAKLAQLARASRREQEAPTRSLRSGAASASVCAASSCVNVRRSRDRSAASSSARSNVPCSPVPCTSTKRPVAAHHDVHVDFGAHVLLVVEIESRLAVDDADAHRRDTPLDRRRRQLARSATIQSKASTIATRRTGDRGGAGAAVGDEHVAIELDGELAKPEVVEHRAYAAADEALNLLGATTELSALTRRARARRARAALRTRP